MVKRPKKTKQLREGDRFNPYRQYHGVYIPDPVFRSKLSPGAKLCYGRLLRYNGQDNKCHPKIGTLAKELSTTERNTQKYLKELSEKGFIRRIPPPNQKGKRLPNDIEFLFHRVYIEVLPKDYR